MSGECQRQPLPDVIRNPIALVCRHRVALAEFAVHLVQVVANAVSAAMDERRDKGGAELFRERPSDLIVARRPQLADDALRVIRTDPRVTNSVTNGLLDSSACGSKLLIQERFGSVGRDIFTTERIPEGLLSLLVSQREFLLQQGLGSIR